MAEAKANDTTTSTDRSDTAAGAAVGVDPARVVQVDPGTLLVDLNVRRETVTDKEFVASVREFGILQPVLAVRTAEGELRVRMGHRRTLAAVELGLATVPVIVVADERTDKTGQIERLLSQFHENEHRTGLATTDRLGMVEQLSLLNVSAAQLAKKSGMKRPQVEQAIAVTKSDLAKAASERYDLTLDQAAAIAEFEEDAETVKALVAAAATGQFPHVLERARQDRADVEHRARAEQELAATGVRVIDAPAFRDSAKPLGWQVCAPDGDEISAEDHATCPGHVGWVTAEWVLIARDEADLAAGDDGHGGGDGSPVRRERRWIAKLGCAEAGHHHPQPDDDEDHAGGWDEGDLADRTEADAEAGAEAAELDRQQVIEGNKAWDAAVNVRRAWLRDLFQRKTPPTGAAAFVAQAVVTGDHAIRRAFDQTHRLAVDLFGVDGAGRASDSDSGKRVTTTSYSRRADLATLLEGVSDKRLTLVTLTIVLAAYEEALDRHSWRGSDGCPERHYLRYLDSLGYPLCDVERRAAGLEPLNHDE